jgi:membrane protease YdiL (CAAX protease family)
MSTDLAITVVFLAVLAVSATAAVWHRWRHRTPLGLGVRGVPVGRHLLLGAAIGAAGIGVTTGLMRLTGHAGITRFAFDGQRLGLALAVLAVAAVGEEVVYRVLMLGGLWRLTGSAGWALVLSAVVFGLVHLTGSDPDASVVSVLSNTLGGVMYSIAFLRTGRIWLPVGLHFAWNFVQGAVLGFVISGDADYSNALFRVHTSGPLWLGGGRYGLEGSVFSLVGRAVIIALVILLTRPNSSGGSAGTGAGSRGRRPQRSVEAYLPSKNSRGRSV